MTQTGIEPGVRDHYWMLGVFWLLLGATNAFSQQSANVVAPQAELDLLGAKVGATVTRPAVVRNDRSSALTISGVNLVCGSAPFAFVSAVKLPLTLNPGDTALLGTVSFTATSPNQDYVGYLMVNYDPHIHSEDGRVLLHATSTMDSPLPGQDPLTARSNETRTILVRFKPNSQKAGASNESVSDVLVEPIATANDNLSDHPSQAVGVLTTPPTLIVSLTDTNRVLGMTGSDWQFTRDFTFQNQGTKEITITDASMEAGNQAMTITSLCGAQLPITVAPGEKFRARVSYTAPNMDAHSDKLVFENDDTDPIVFKVQAQRVAASSVRNGVNRRQIAMQIQPHSTSGTISIELQYGYKGDITIYSSTGALIAQAKNVSSWTWGPSAAGTARVANGEYVLRVQCHDTDGVTLTRSERLVVLDE